MFVVKELRFLPSRAIGIQLTEENAEDVYKWVVLDHEVKKLPSSEKGFNLKIKGKGYEFVAVKGDWIVKTESGILFVIPEAVFKVLLEEVW